MTKKKGETLTDSQLVHDFTIKGDNKAFNALVERHRAKIYNQILFTVRDSDVADDLYQDACIKLFMMLRDGKYSEEGKFPAWFARLTSNIVMDYYRRRPSTAEQNLSFDSEEVHDVFNRVELAEPSTEHKLVEQQIKDNAVRLMHALPETQREILEMRFYQDLSFKEIAEKKGLSINTALGRMHYAVNNMRKMARQYAVSLSA